MHNGEEEWKVKNSIHVNAAAVFSPIKFMIFLHLLVTFNVDCFHSRYFITKLFKYSSYSFLPNFIVHWQ